MDKKKIFISYAREDEQWKNQLVRHLNVLRMNTYFKTWNDRDIEYGSDWRTEIENELSEASIVIMMISADYLISEFIINYEIPIILERRKKNELRAIPVILKPCPWSRVEWLNSIQVFGDGAPLIGQDESKTEQYFSRLADDIHNVMGSIKFKKKSEEQNNITETVESGISLNPESKSLFNNLFDNIKTLISQTNANKTKVIKISISITLTVLIVISTANFLQKENLKISYSDSLLALKNYYIYDSLKILSHNKDPQEKNLSTYIDLGDNLYEISYNNENLGCIYIPPEANVFSIFSQAPNRKGEGSSEFFCNMVDKKTALENLGEYIIQIKKSGNKLILTADDGSGKWGIGGDVRYGIEINHLKFLKPSYLWHPLNERSYVVMGLFNFN